MSVSDLNEHYYEAEQTFLVTVDGTIRVEMDRALLEQESPTEPMRCELVENAALAMDQILDATISGNEM